MARPLIGMGWIVRILLYVGEPNWEEFGDERVDASRLVGNGVSEEAVQIYTTLPYQTGPLWSIYLYY